MINVLIVQIEAVVGDIEKNIEKVDTLLSSSSFESVDLILLPELWTVGWDSLNFNRYSESINNSKFVDFLKKIAIKYNSNVVGGSSILRKDGEKDRNTTVIFDRQGNLLSTYDKFHLFSHRGESEGTFLEEGETPVIVKTDIGNIGISICYDIRFPELYRTYAFKGVDFIVNMAAWPEAFADEYVTLAKARAIENQLYFLTSALTGKINQEYNFSGKSMVIDFRGKVVAELERQEAILQAQIDIDLMKQYRQQMPILYDTKRSYQILER